MIATRVNRFRIIDALRILLVQICQEMFHEEIENLLDFAGSENRNGPDLWNYGNVSLLIVLDQLI